MKELTLTRTITDFTAQDYYQAIYATEQAFQRYHYEESKDPEAKVTAWKSADGQDSMQRQVHFQLALNVPQMLKKFIGTDSVGVVETQSIIWHGKDKFMVTSAPSLNFPGSNKFTTQGHTTVQTSTHGRACEVVTVVECNAAMPWPMQSTVEAAMASEAQAGIGKFLDFCKKRCEALKVEQLLRQPLAAEPPPAAATAVAAPVLLVPQQQQQEEEAALAAGGDEFFYDALDEAQQESFGSLAGAAAAAAGTQLGRPALAAGRGVSPHDVMTLAALRELQVSSHTTAQALADVAEQLRQLNDSVLAIRAAVAGSLPPHYLQQPARASAGAPASAGLALLGMLAGMSACGLMYLRSRVARGGSS